MAIRETLEREVKLRAGEDFDAARARRRGDRAAPLRLDLPRHRRSPPGAPRRHAPAPRREREGAVAAQAARPGSRGSSSSSRGLARHAAGRVARPARRPPARQHRSPPIARLSTRREGVRADGAEIVHDTVAVLDHQRVTRSFDELEVELLDGDERTLRRIEKALRRAGAADGEQRPKVFQALDLDFHPESELPAEDDSTAGTLRARVHEQAERVLAHDPGTRLGVDAEELHQMRVATRRLRAFLRAGRELLDPEWAEPLREELRWLGSALGPVRDLDVLIEHLTPGVEPLGSDAVEGRKLLRTLERDRRKARRALLRRARQPSLLRAPRRARAARGDGRRSADAPRAPRQRAQAAAQGGQGARARLARRRAARGADQGEAGAVRGRAAR